MKNTLLDLNNHLFAQMERLSDEDISPTQLQKEIERSKSISMIARDITDNAELVLNAQKFISDAGQITKQKMPKMLQG